MNKEELEILHELAFKMHPHIEKGANHTSKLIDKLYNKEGISNKEIFDLGKYYDRMFTHLDQSKMASTKEFRKTSAILALKNAVYSYN
jgi:hypothetical protein